MQLLPEGARRLAAWCVVILLAAGVGWVGIQLCAEFRTAVVPVLLALLGTALLGPLYRRMVAAVREVDSNHVVILGGAQWDANFKVFGKPFDSNVMYTFHKYWTATDASVIKEYVDFRDKYKVPIWLGESNENKDE